MPFGALMIIATTLSGCSIHAMTGDVMTEYTTEHLTPYLLGTDDLDMACELGVSMGQFLLSFERVTSRPDQAAVSTMTTAALCAELAVSREELRGLRALKAQNIPRLHGVPEPSFRDGMIVGKPGNIPGHELTHQPKSREPTKFRWRVLNHHYRGLDGET